MEPVAGRRRPGRADRRERRARGAQHEGQGGGVRGRRPPGAGDPRGRRHQHDRHRAAAPHTACCRQQRARPQRRRRRRADDGPDPGDRPADRRQRRRPACGAVGEEEVRQGRGPARLDPRASSGSGSIGLRVAERAAAFGIQVQALARPEPREGERRIAPRSSGSRSATRCPSCWRPPTSSPCTCRPAPDTKDLVDERLPRPDEAGRDPGQHLARRRRRRGGAARGPRRRRHPRRPRRVRRRAGLRSTDVGLRRWPSTRRRRPPTTSAPPPAGPARDRGRRRRDRRRLRRGREPALRQPRPRPARGRHPHASGTSTASACWPGCWTC